MDWESIRLRQVRGYADQSLRNKHDPEDPANRRISVIVQYLEGDAPKAAPETARCYDREERKKDGLKKKRSQSPHCGNSSSLSLPIRSGVELKN